jgi:hypothetical protein
MTKKQKSASFPSAFSIRGKSIKGFHGRIRHGDHQKKRGKGALGGLLGGLAGTYFGMPTAGALIGNAAGDYLSPPPPPPPQQQRRPSKPPKKYH